MPFYVISAMSLKFFAVAGFRAPIIPCPWCSYRLILWNTSSSIVTLYRHSSVNYFGAGIPDHFECVNMEAIQRTSGSYFFASFNVLVHPRTHWCCGPKSQH